MKIDKCYYINLDKRPDRKEHIEKEIEKSNILRNICEKFPAIDGTFLHPREVNKEYPNLLSENGISDILCDEITTWGLSITQGGLGVILSYIKIFEKTQNKEYLTITLEDDVYLHDDFDKLLNKALSELPNDFDLCYLGYGGNDIEKEIYSENLSIPKGVLTCLPSLIISPKGAKKLISILKNIDHQIDTVIYKNFNKLSVYVVNTKLVEIKNRLSTNIQGNNNCIKNYKKQNYIFATLAYGDNANNNAYRLTKDLDFFNQKILIVTNKPKYFENTNNTIIFDYPNKNFSYNDKILCYEHGLNYEDCVMYIDSDCRIFYDDYKKTLTNFYRIVENGFHPSLDWGRLVRNDYNFFIGKDINDRVDGYNEFAKQIAYELEIPVDEAFHYQEGILGLCKDNGNEKVFLKTWRELAKKLDNYEIQNNSSKIGCGEGNLIGLAIVNSKIRLNNTDFCNQIGEYIKYNFYGDRFVYFTNTHQDRKTPFITEKEILKTKNLYVEFKDKKIDLNYTIFIHDDNFFVLKFTWNRENNVEVLDHEFKINDEVFHFFSDKTNHFFFKRTNNFKVYHTYDWYGEKDWKLIDAL